MSDAGDAVDEVVHDFAPLIVVYRSGRLERPLAMPPIPPGTDAATGVVSRDVHLSPSSFVRLYLPPPGAGGARGGERLSVIVYFHGGGFVIGSAASPAYHRCLNYLAAACPVVAVSVYYRLAPEHPLPAAYEDSLAALTWVLSAADPWLAAHGDLSRVFLAGDSAGGNICHHLAMHHDLIRGSAGRRLKGIVLIHPWFWGKQPIGEEPRGEAAAAKEQKGLWEFVCPDAEDGADDPRMNPTAAGAPGLENLACEKVMVCVAEEDALRWRGRAYAEAVTAARARGRHGAAAAAAELLESEGVGHVFYLFEPAHAKADELLRRIAAFVRAK